MYNEPDAKQLYELTIFFKESDTEVPRKEVHLVLARNPLDASSQLNKYYIPEGDIVGMQTELCTRYKHVIVGRKAL